MSSSPRQAFSIRLSPQERSRYQSLADSRGVKLGEWIRDAMLRRAEEEENQAVWDQYEKEHGPWDKKNGRWTK